MKSKTRQAQAGTHSTGKPGPYQEDRHAGNSFREQYHVDLWHLVHTHQKEAERERHQRCREALRSPSAWQTFTAQARLELTDALGWPLGGRVKQNRVPRARVKKVGRDAYGRIERIWIPTGFGPSLYGLLFLSETTNPAPLVIAQHGGQGTPEICSSFFPSSNYNDMVLRFRKRGVAVFAPQLYLWAPEFGPEKKRQELDLSLKQLGGSIAALEIFSLQRALDALGVRPEIDAARIGMAGLSYGGFYTLFATAIEPRIQAALVSCFVNDRFRYNSPDWVWQDSGHKFGDAEVAALIFPRPLWIENGLNDTLFEIKSARPVAAQIRHIYKTMGKSDCLRIAQFNGGHEFRPTDEGIDFLLKSL